MRDEALLGPRLSGRAIDNSQVAREVDPRSVRELWWLLAVVFALAGGLGFYAWPHFAVRQSGIAFERMQRERERLIEENRKLRLEKASLEDLRRIERLAAEKGLQAPPAERVVVVERPAPPPQGAQLASGPAPARAP